MKIQEIINPQFLKNLSKDELQELANDIRLFLIDSVSKTGGHLSSNLGIVELTMAVHIVFDGLKDKIIFDVGHQSYIHKILTGRVNQFASLRQYNGLSGFQKMKESPYDIWEAGHAGTALSAGLGMAIARDLNNDKHEVVCIVGDGALPNGMCFEALNQIGASKHKLIIILNDNAMSISKNVGAFGHSLNRLRNSTAYYTLKKDVKTVLKKNIVGEQVLGGLKYVKDKIKQNVVKSSIFDDLGLEYFGPVDGHNFTELIHAFKSAKDHDGSVVIHVITKKGKGFNYSENDKSGKWHGVNQFDPDTGLNTADLPSNHISWSELVNNTLMQLAKTDPKILVLTPAMIQGSKLEAYFKTYPFRSIDCGIAEEHAATLSASLALSGYRPFLSIYSTFLQRAYDQINHDIARMNCPVVIGIDRAGLIGEDGPTHHGVFDIGILRPLPNIVISEAKDAVELQNLLYSAFLQTKPFAIRYPRGSIENVPLSTFESIQIGTWVNLKPLIAKQKTIISYGPDIDRILQKIEANSSDINVINARFIKPLDEIMLNKLCDLNIPIYIYETDMMAGGLGSAILEWMQSNQRTIHIDRIGIEDHYVPHGSVYELRKLEHIDLNYLFSIVEKNKI